MSRIAADMKAAARLPAGARVGIPPRHIDFRVPEHPPRYPFADNALVTAFHAVLSGIFPPGERFFAESVRRYRDRITDPTLKAQVSGFMGQEAIHGHEHEKLNEHFKQHGFDTAVPDRMIRGGLWLLERLPPSQQLACTGFMEHFTARLGQLLLTDESFIRQTDPEMIKLWQWHALEELEHKAVAFDVYEAIGNREIERRLAMPLVVAALLPPIVLSWAWLVLRDPQAGQLREHARGLRLLLGREGFVTRILPKMGVFWRPGFHPAKHDTRALVEEWRQRLFGSDGVLRDQLRNREMLAA
ncbi:metal-dependent hydrolase [Solimonas sp. K1W22B-7]|uniref:metal-dependent hydrolase n=1 Tax=Solimonas sp. K1W22B-7 TaxID=2303331 RepID=UPI001968C732|nr:metal-dependent hydrolase [Solimonas sp. K1W22B-7]